MSNPIRAPRLLLSALPPLALLAGCVEPAEEDLAETSTDLIVVEPAPIVRELASGLGWKRVGVTGTFRDIDTGATTSSTDRPLVAVDSVAGVDASPLPATVRNALRATYADTSQPAPAWFVDEQLAAQVDEYARTANTSYFSACSDYDRTFDFDRATTRSIEADLSDLDSRLSGLLGASLEVGVGASLEVTLRIKRAQTYVFGCVAYAVSLRSFHVGASADLTSRFHFDGSINVPSSTPVRVRKEVARFQLPIFSFGIGPFGIAINPSIPLEAGVDISGTMTADLDYTYAKHLEYGVTCTMSSCSSTSDSSSAFIDNQPGGLQLSGRAAVTPWAKASLRVALYSDSIAYFQIGPRARTDVDLWAYAGSSCGDGNGDGVNEYVTGATMDTSFGLDLSANLALLGRQVLERNWTLVSGYRLNFQPILGRTSALEPIFYDSSTTQSASRITTTVRGRMRPCWPYANAVEYRVAWGDGTTETFSASPTSLFSRSHTYPVGMTWDAVLTARKDGSGRTLGTATGHPIRSPIIIDPIRR